MNNLVNELNYLREMSIEMMIMVKNQHEKAKNALVEFNLDLAEEIIRTEQRVNALELSIENKCENIIALFQPVATDLRFVLSIFKFVSELERIGDHADAIAKFLLDKTEPFDKEILKALKLEEMFNETNSMFEDVILAMNENNSAPARKVFKKDKDVNKHLRTAKKTIGDELSKFHPQSNELLTLYSAEVRLERVGDLLTNVAEEIIFYLEAEIMKHQNKKKTPAKGKKLHQKPNQGN